MESTYRMTRMCRAQFEQDDIEEAEIMCGHNLGSEEPDAELGDISRKDANDLRASALTGPGNHRRHPSILTWKLPAWVNFSYSTMQHRRHHRRRQPNPFRPQSQEFSRLKSMSDDMHREARHASESPPKSSIQDFPWGGVSPTASNGTMHLNLTAAIGPVADHPPPIPWDDQTTVDLPYDNPFYTRTFDNILWLPRNPFGILDLDETVDLKVSLCVDVAAGMLGTWLGLTENSSPDGVPEAQSSTGLPPSSSDNPFYDGTEEIELPPVIAQRVQSREDGIEQTLRPRRPSAYRRKNSSATVSANLSTGTSLEPRRPSVRGENSLPVNFRSFSDGNGPNTTTGRGRSSSILSVLQSPRMPRARSTDHEFGRRPTLQVHAEVLSGHIDGSKSQLSVASRARSHNVSAREAIFNEVLAEEKAALIDRIEDEEAEKQKAAATKSWLTAWMFRKGG
ncbi:hypothetical protein DXG03_004906 [Asterophora parasitica]|uniref:Uncharacterized protein n=1 Tax=Asterophora parasitica TaxID=117018 RepID=A0A9P7GEW4_9AGAR|nr:hypothetical protein DXG03_004906 [Asterophora parasitica]